MGEGRRYVESAVVLLVGAGAISSDFLSNFSAKKKKKKRAEERDRDRPQGHILLLSICSVNCFK